MDITKELFDAIVEFEHIFGELIPLQKLPEGTTPKQLVSAIKKCETEGKNLLPIIFGY